MQIKEENGFVTIGKNSLRGFISNKKCPKCSESQICNEDFDAFFCPYCNEWLEGACSDNNCEFCKKRPGKPLKNN